MFIHVKIDQKLDFILYLALKLNKTTFLLIKLETFRLRHFIACEYQFVRQILLYTSENIRNGHIFVTNNDIQP